MKTEDILGFLQIDKNSGTPLRTQLEDRIEALLPELEVETLFPPERLIAEKLEISRVTVRNAMQKFYEQGKFIRHGRRGTMALPIKEQDKLKDYNLMALGASWVGSPAYSLKFLLYENLPPQKKFWTETVDSFNAGKPEFPIEIVWMESISDAAKVDKIIEEQAIDILLDSDLFTLDKAKSYYRFSESFRKQLSSNEYLFDLFRTPMEYSLPVNIVTPMLFRNCDLAEQCGLADIKPALKSGDLIDFAALAVRELPENVFACGRIWDCFSYAVSPEAMESPEHLLPVLKELAEAGKTAGKAADRLFLTSQKSLLEHVELFLQGKMLLLPAQRTFMQVSEAPKFHCEALPYPCRPGQKRVAGHVDIAVTKNCLNPAAAEQFLSWLISPEVQRKCAEVKQMIPVRREECNRMLAEEYRYNAHEIKDFLTSLQFFFHQSYHPPRSFSEFCIYFVKTELIEIFQGRLTPEEAAETIFAKWQRFRNQKENSAASSF